MADPGWHSQPAALVSLVVHQSTTPQRRTPSHCFPAFHIKPNMSDSEGDIDDMILELAGGGASSDKRRRKRQSDSAPKASKRRRHESVAYICMQHNANGCSCSLSDDSDAQGDGDDDASVADPYPLEGKYKDEDDREQCVHLRV
jgi:hypothetical protein